MNILVDKLPTSLEVNGVEYPIDSDFRSCLSTILAFEDTELAEVEKQHVLLTNLYEEIPEDTEAALEKAIWFLNGGRLSPDEEASPMRLYSFEKDSGLIFAAFRQTHGIDLQGIEYLHWWKFIALFLDLGQNTTFCELTSLRKRIKTGKATKEERAMARDMGEMFDLPDYDDRTLEEKEAERAFLEAVGGRQ